MGMSDGGKEERARARACTVLAWTRLVLVPDFFFLSAFDPELELEPTPPTPAPALPFALPFVLLPLALPFDAFGITSSAAATASPAPPPAVVVATDFFFSSPSPTPMGVTPPLASSVAPDMERTLKGCL